MLLSHPSPFLRNQTIFFYNETSRTVVRYQVNDGPAVVVIISTLVHFIDIFDSTWYNCNRLQRINFMFFFNELESSFPLKNYIANNLLSFLVGSLFLSLALFGSMLNITERTFQISVNGNIQDWENILWAIATSMTTIGYGDKIVQTLGSRLVIMVLVVWGNFWFSILISCLFPYLEKTQKEKKCLNLMNRLSF